MLLKQAYVFYVLSSEGTASRLNHRLPPPEIRYGTVIPYGRTDAVAMLGLSSLDVYPKLNDEFRVQTSTGGLTRFYRVAFFPPNIICFRLK